MIRLGAGSLLLAVALSCESGVSSSATRPPEKPTVEEVRTFLSLVAAAVTTGREADLHRFFENPSSYPEEDFATIKSSKFWQLQLSRQITRLGPDAFRIRLLPPPAPPSQGFIQIRSYIDLPVRRDRNGQLRILSRRETERLKKLPVPQAAEGDAVVELDYPDEGDSSREGGRHFATEIWADAGAIEIRLHLRFDPPLTGPKLRADLPTMEGLSPLGGEISVELSLDADASGTTGSRMDQVYRRLNELDGGSSSLYLQRIREWDGFGTDKKLTIEGKKFVTEDGGRAWAIRVALRNVTAEVESAGGWSDRGETVFEKTQTAPEVKVGGDILTITVPVALLPMRQGGSYRVVLEQNSGHGLLLKARKGRVGTR
jgi:hypothetical protein